MSQYVVGIDLGTSNSALAYAPLDEARLPIGLLELPQLVDVGVVERRRLLPSFLYIPAEAETQAGGLGVPWDASGKLVVGAFARDHGAQVPDRLVSSAKSWLCHAAVDRRGPILPWGKGDDGVRKVSPLEATARYLLHLRRAFEAAHPEAPLGQQRVILTVPASFDPGARELTVEAARAAGLPNVVLLEEPQAAVYAWLEKRGESWRKELSVGDRVLVVDIGGGTTDFSLIDTVDEEGSLGLRRVAVGDHILLGGDNMDYALAFALKKELEEGGAALDAWQMRVLVQACRAAKEALLLDEDAGGPTSQAILVPNRGAKLFKKNLKAELTRERVLEVVLQGFFPSCGPDATPEQRRVGLTQLGLPYATDPAITRHLAQFLTRHAREGEAFALPTAILFNGGVLGSPAIQQRITQVISTWLAEADAPEARVLSGAELDVAVARGAAAYGQAREGGGLRIRGGTARTYYVGVEQPMPAVPGYEPPVTAVCVAPFGMEEGTALDLPAQRFGLVVGQPARFRFFSSSVRKTDPIGSELDPLPPDLEELAPIETTLDGTAGAVVEVGLSAAVTPVGTLELSCVDAAAERRWKLEFDVRDRAA